MAVMVVGEISGLSLEKDDAVFAKFRDSKLGPAFGKVGDIPAPKITVVPVHFRWGK